MGRRKIEIKAIKDDRNRSVTFLKRKGGLFKKAHELSVLCSVDVAVIIFGHNKKLYEFSSGDINETIGRYQYYGVAHEHKGPEDFMGKKDGDDDDDDDDIIEGNGQGPAQSHSPPEHPMMPHHLQHNPQFQHVRQTTPSASPPLNNGVPFPHRGPSPLPPHGQPGISRPPSAQHIRRPSSNLAPQQHPQVSHPQGPQPNYAYMPSPPIYNPQMAQGMAVRGPAGQAPMAPQSYPQQQYPHPHPSPNPQIQQTYAQSQEPRRSSMPPTYPQQQQQQQHQAPPPPAPSHTPQQDHQLPPPPQQPTINEPSPPRVKTESFSSPPQLPQPKPLPAHAKNHSIFTPIDDSRSLLAQHWGSTGTSSETLGADLARSQADTKQELPRSQSIDVASIGRHDVNGNSQPSPPQKVNTVPLPGRNTSTPSVPIIVPPSRTNSMKIDSNRPRLKVQIPPSESGEEPSATGSPRDITAAATLSSPRNGTGVVLPPPSPSASALLSAGASGPPNPFARPAPPQMNGSFGRSNDMETPISALPSRFMSDQLLPSPSSFYPEWGFGRGDNMFQSPVGAPWQQTPVAANGPSFKDEDERKRKAEEEAGEAGKRIKT